MAPPANPKVEVSFLVLELQQALLRGFLIPSLDLSIERIIEECIYFWSV